MMKRILRIAGSLLLALTVIFSASAAALAADLPDWERTGSIAVTPKSVDADHAVVTGARFTLYRVADAAERDGSLAWEMTAAFQASGEELSDLNASGLAERLASFAADKGLSGTAAAADEAGTVRFEGLSLGLYLLVQDGTAGGGYAADPFLVTLPMYKTGEGWVYDIEASPKAETYETTSLTVKKVWNDGGDAKSRPETITIRLYDGGTLVDSVTLSTANEWTFTWPSLPKSDGYYVREDSVSGYATTYSVSGSVYTVTNTPSLVQTGQLNWPIPVLAGCGVALFAVGWALVFLSKKKRCEGK